VLTLKRHSRPVKAVRFSPDGRYILTGSEDHRAILWPTKDWMAEKRTELEKTPVSETGEAADTVGLKAN
jgi:WD40 repeat protein